VLDGEVQEITPAGQLVGSWRTNDHIGLDETRAVGIDTTKVPPPAGDGNTFDMSDGRILWKLGGTHTAQSLRVIGDPQGGPDGQHDARRWPDGTVSMHDNGTFRGHAPRVARYRIDAKRRWRTTCSATGHSRCRSRR
jgi:hypothetical protein